MSFATPFKVTAAAPGYLYVALLATLSIAAVSIACTAVLPLWAKVPALVLLSLVGLRSWQQMQQGRAQLIFRPDGSVGYQHHDTVLSPGRSWVSRHLLLVPVRCSGRRSVQVMIISHRHNSEDQLRRLRVWLFYARNVND